MSRVWSVWVRVPPEAAHFFLGKVTALGVLCCFALFDLACFFLSSLIKNTYIIIKMFIHVRFMRMRVYRIAYRGLRIADFGMRIAIIIGT